MSLAFSAVLLFLIIVPGLVARFFYFTYPFSNEARSTELLNEVFWSIVPGFLIQIIYIKLLAVLGIGEVSFADIGFLLLGDGDSKRVDRIFSSIDQNVWKISAYYFLLILFAVLTGLLMKRIVRSLKLDKRLEFFRFTNKWYYILSGEILDIKRLPDSSKNIVLTLVDVLCKVGNDTYIYRGELKSYYLKGNGELDGLLLEFPARKRIEEESDKSTSYHYIPGDFMFIPYRDVININVHYFKLDL